MKVHVPEKRPAEATWTWRMVIALLALALPFPAFAALGASLDSVQNDQDRLQARIRVTAVGAYTIHEMTSPTGTVVREYVSSTGRVFGLTWQGPFIPDMQQLLGAYFERYSQAAKNQRERHAGRFPLDIREPRLVVQTAGHMRAYSGRAYDPGLLPAGVSDHDVR